MAHVAESDNQGWFLRFPEIYCRLKECLTSYTGVADCELQVSPGVRGMNIFGLPRVCLYLWR